MDDALAKLRRERWATTLLWMIGMLIVVGGVSAGALVERLLF
jgi:hypothetical protein